MDPVTRLLAKYGCCSCSGWDDGSDARIVEEGEEEAIDMTDLSVLLNSAQPLTKTPASGSGRSVGRSTAVITVAKEFR